MSPAFAIPLCRPSIGEREIAVAADAWRSGRLVQGERCAAFEEALARRCGRRHAVVVSSGTAALAAALAALDIGPGDEVLVPDYTFPATANVVALAGARPVLVDVLPTTWNMDAAIAAAAMGPRTRVVMPVDQFGLPADEPALRAAAARAGTGAAILVDAACAIGGEDPAGRPAEARGTLACLSFHPRKTITTGEGGAVLCDDDALAARLRRLRNHGQEAGDFREPGWNLRMTEPQAAMGLSQLERLDEMIEARRALAARYRERLDPLAAAGRMRFQEPEGGRHPYQTMAVLLDPPLRPPAPGAEGAALATTHRDAIRAAMAERGVEVGMTAWALHRTPAFRADAARFPVTDALFARGLALPCWAEMAPAQVDMVCDALLSVAREVRT